MTTRVHAPPYQGLDSAAFVGDLDGDGYDDFVVGDRSRTHVAEQAGSVYVFYGGPDRFTGGISVSDANAELRGETNHAWASEAARAGDVNGDGYGDFVVSAEAEPHSSPGVGRLYVVFGGSERLEGDPMLGEVGVPIEAPDGSVRIGNVSAGCDVDGDGVGEVLVPATIRRSGRPDLGIVYLFAGSTLGAGAPLGLDDARTVFQGTADGRSVDGRGALVGDIDGDGFCDVAVNLDSAEPGVALYYGRPDLPAALGPGDANAVAEGASLVASSAGDFDWDEWDDVAFSAGGDSNRRVQLVYGDSSRLSGTFDVRTSARWTLLPEDSSRSFLGGSLAHGDFDGDGVSDLFVGDSDHDSQAGAAYVLYGAWGRRFGTHAAAEPDVLLRGEAGEEVGDLSDDLGARVAGGGDVDGDGRSEVLVVAPTNGGIGSEEGGSVWLIYGAPRYYRYVRCHVDLDGDPDSLNSCAGGAGTAGPLGDGRVACLCLSDCETSSDCPRPLSGTISPACVRSDCRLPCASGGTCPDGMVCAPELESCAWPSD